MLVHGTREADMCTSVLCKGLSKQFVEPFIDGCALQGTTVSA